METLQEVEHAKTWCGQVQGDLLHAEAIEKVLQFEPSLALH